MLPPGAMQRPGVGIGTQETREITEWNPQIRLPVCLHGYDYPPEEALIDRSDATGPHTRIGWLRRPGGGVRWQQRCLVDNFAGLNHLEGLDVGIPVLSRQAGRHIAEGGSWWGCSFGRLQRDSTIRWSSSCRRWWEPSVWSRRYRAAIPSSRRPFRRVRASNPRAQEVQTGQVVRRLPRIGTA